MYQRIKIMLKISFTEDVLRTGSGDCCGHGDGVNGVRVNCGVGDDVGFLDSKACQPRILYSRGNFGVRIQWYGWRPDRRLASGRGPPAHAIAPKSPKRNQRNRMQPQRLLDLQRYLRRSKWPTESTEPDSQVYRDQSCPPRRTLRIGRLRDSASAPVALLPLQNVNQWAHVTWPTLMSKVRKTVDKRSSCLDLVADQKSSQKTWRLRNRARALFIMEAPVGALSFAAISRSFDELFRNWRNFRWDQIFIPVDCKMKIIMIWKDEKDGFAVIILIDESEHSEEVALRGRVKVM